MKKNTVIFLLLLSFVSSGVKAQFVDAPAMQHYFDFSEKDTNKLLLDFWNENFLKNTEYFGPITHGMTLFGADLNAQLGYVPCKYLMILGGIYVRKDDGNLNLEIVQPTWTIKLQNNGVSFIMGNIESTMDHRYIQPLYQCLFPVTYYGETYENPLETGLQFKVDKPWLWLDAWIDWAHQEYLNSNYHEHILQGISTDLTIWRPNDVFKATVPIQYTFFHYGGQIDTVHAAPETIYDGAAGLTLNWDFSKRNSFIQKIKLEGYACAYKYLSRISDIQLPFISGNGAYANLDVKTKYGFGIVLSYWNANGWIAPLGGDLYQSVSWVYGSYTESNRNLAFLRLYYQKELFPNFYVDLRLEPYRDINLGFTEYAYYAFLTYKRTFTLTKMHLPKFNDSEYSH